MKFKRIEEIDVKGKKVLIRADMNAPIKDGQVADDARIRASLDTIRLCADKGAGVIVMTHLGRPKEGAPKPEDSVEPLARRLAKLLGVADVPVIENWRNGVDVLPGQVAMLPNVRINVGEKADDETLAQAYADLADIYVNDAFGAAHRAQASTHTVALKAKVACAGVLLAKELDSLAKLVAHPAHPVVAVVGGSKVSTKLSVLKKLAEMVDGLIVGGGIANTFLAAEGKNIGKSLSEPDLTEEALAIARTIKSKGGQLPLPIDAVVAKEFAADAPAATKSIENVADDDMILDVGPRSRDLFDRLLRNAKTIMWNGPVGVFEFEAFAQGTQALTRSIAESPAYTLAGGGDTLAAINVFGAEGKIDYVSTGGGAFLEFIEGKTLPAVEALEQRAG